VMVTVTARPEQALLPVHLICTFIHHSSYLDSFSRPGEKAKRTWHFDGKKKNSDAV
jgi:hypothetical protein